MTLCVSDVLIHAGVVALPRVDRFSVSLDTELLAAFDALISERGYTNRSEAIRDLLRDWLTESRPANNDSLAIGVLTVVCNWGVSDAPARLRKLLSSANDLVSATTSTVLDSNRDVITVSLRGRAVDIRCQTDKIQALRGISHAHLSMIPAA